MLYLIPIFNQKKKKKKKKKKRIYIYFIFIIVNFLKYIIIYNYI